MSNPDAILWTSGFFNERFPAPVSPLGWSHLAPAIEATALRDPLRFLGYPAAETIPLLRLWRGHPYANARAFQIIYKVFPNALVPEDAARYFPAGDLAFRQRAPYPRWVDAPRLLASLLRAFCADPFNVSPLTNHAHWVRYTREHDARIGAVHAHCATLQDAPPHEIFRALRVIEDSHRDFLRIHRWSLVDADLTFGLLKRLSAAWIDPMHANEIAARLVADVPHKTREVDRALREIAAGQIEISSAPLRAFLAEHGHRSFSLDLAVPTFADDPTQVAQLLAQNSGGEKNATEENCAVTFRLPTGARGAWFNRLCDLTRRYVGLREDQRYYWQKALAVARRLYGLLAERLVAEGVIAERAAVFYATHSELADYFAAPNGGDVRRNVAALTQTIAARQSEWRVYQREFEQSPATAYPTFLLDDAPVENDRPRVARVSREWHGRAISPGIARGVARVVTSAQELAAVLPGEILIAPATDPAWTPVFARLAGLVVARGGMLSHSAVVAREYRLPAVAGIANIGAEIQTGEWIEVDGSAGVIRVLSTADAPRAHSPSKLREYHRK